MKTKYIATPLLAIFLYFYLSLFSNALIDDSFITLRYVKTLLSSGTWGFLPGYTANAVTSPLNVILLTLTGIFLGPTVNAAICLATALLTFIAATLVRMSRLLFETEIFGYLAAGALIFNPLIISTLGLESMLFASLYILSAYFYITGRWLLLAATLGLITVTRFDGFLFFLTTLPLIPAFKLRLKFAAIYILCIAPWHIFSWLYLGSLFPDTLFIKMSQRSLGWNFFNGMGGYLRTYPLEIILSFLLLPFALAFFNKQAREAPFVRFLALTCLAHFTGYSLLRVPPYHWYYIPEATAVILIGSFGLGALSKSGASELMRRGWLQGIVAILLIFQAAGMFYILAKDGFSIKEMPIHTNWATHERYKEIGEWLKKRDNGGVIMAYGGEKGTEVGTIGYYCDCYLLSSFSDRKWLRQYVDEQSAGKGVGSWLHRVNFLFFDKNAEIPRPAYLLQETPGGERADKTNIMAWKTATKWLPRCLITLSDFSSAQLRR